MDEALRNLYQALRREWAAVVPVIARALRWLAAELRPVLHLTQLGSWLAATLTLEGVTWLARAGEQRGRAAGALALARSEDAGTFAVRVAQVAATGIERTTQTAARTVLDRWQAPRPAPRSLAAPRTLPRILLGLASWLLVIAGGAATGAGFALYQLFSDAKVQVNEYLAKPPIARASVVWSAPIEIRSGLPLDLDAFGADLIAAGLDRVPAGGTLAEGQFRIDEGAIEVWTPAYASVDAELASLRVRVVTRDGRVARIEPSEGFPHPGFPLVLPPIPLATLGDPDSHRTPVTLAQLSPWLETALLSMEDERFRSHFGIDLIGIARALFTDVSSRELQGGSTITQQLAKNLFLTRERSVRRKVHEVLYAFALEAALDKDQLLELYLSEIYLGQMGAMPLHGAEAAARAWFGRSAAALDAAQAATIVGVIPAPNAWSPVRNPDGALMRRNLALEKMAQDGQLTPDQLAAALASPLGIDGLEPSRIRRAPYAVDVAMASAEQHLGASTSDPAPFDGGYGLHTTIQPLLQRAAEDAIADGLAELVKEHPDLADAQAALVAVRIADGQVVAMVGGRSYAESPFNRASEAHRQVGSTVKPFTMLAAIQDQKAGPNTVLVDEPITRKFGDEIWTPGNYDGTFIGPMSVRRVIEKSRNVPSILLAERVGFRRLQELLREVGFAEATRVPSTALGAFTATPMEMAGAWTVFDGGIAQRPHVLVAISDRDGGLVTKIAPEPVRVASPAAAAVATHVLEGVLRAGTGARASNYGVGPPAAGKSGTTDEFRDAWFVGLTHEYAVAVWVGRDEGLLGLAGSVAALPTWARFVASTAGSKAPRERPDGVTSVEVCADTGLRAAHMCTNRTWEWVTRSMVPAECTGEGHPEDVLPEFEEEVELIRLDELTRRFWPRRRSREN